MGHDLVQKTSPLQPAPTLPEWWGALYGACPGASIFVSPGWIQSWLDVYADAFTGQWVHWEKAGQVVGGCLLLKRTVWWRFIPLPTVFVNVAAETAQLSPWSEYNEPLFLAGHEEAVAQALGELISGTGWARFELWGYLPNSFSQRLLAALPTTTVQSREERAPYIDLAAFRGKEYESTISSRTRSQIRRCRRMYEEQSGPIELEFARTLEEALDFLKQLASMHNAIWRSRGETPSFEVPEFQTFHEAAVRRLWPEGAVDLLRVRNRDKVIGYLLNFKRNGKIFCYQSGFVQEEDPHLKPGLLTHSCAISEYGRQGFGEYDLLGGDSRYKRSLTKVHRTIVFSTCYRDSMYARALWAGRQLKARLKPESGAPGSSEEELGEAGARSGADS
jgi:hypothetical protein